MQKRQITEYSLHCDDCGASAGAAPSEAEAHELASNGGYVRFEYGYPGFSVFWFCPKCLPLHELNRSVGQSLTTTNTELPPCQLLTSNDCRET
jgi:hypothetical protein